MSEEKEYEYAVSVERLFEVTAPDELAARLKAYKEIQNQEIEFEDLEVVDIYEDDLEIRGD